MSLTSRLGELTNTAYVLIVPAFILAMFVFWRSKRSEVSKTEEIYRLIGRLFFVLPVVGVIFHLISDNAVPLATIAASYVVYRWTKTLNLDVWETADEMVVPYIILLGVWPVIVLLEGDYRQAIARLVVWFIVVGWNWYFSQRYRRLTWYPSGKIGFMYLSTGMVFALFYGISGVIVRGGIHWQDSCWFMILLLLFNVFLVRSGLVSEENYWLVKLINNGKLVLKLRKRR